MLYHFHFTADRMFYTIPLFRTLGVVEVIQCTYQISGDPADPFKGSFPGFVSAAAGTGVTDDAGVSAGRVMVNRMVDGAVPDTGFLHAPYDVLEGIQIFQRISIQFDVCNVPAVGQLMIRCFQTDLVVGGNIIIYRNMERVGIIFSVGDAGDDAVLLLVDP